MLDGGWRHFAKAGGLLALALFVYGLNVLGGGYQEHGQPIGSQASQPQSNSPSPAEIASAYAERACQKPEESENADLCQQWRMAEIANNQYRVLIVQTGVLVLTLFAAGYAAREAGRIVGVTREIGEAQTRAYLSITNAVFDIPEMLQTARAIFTVKNSGNSPALGAYVSCRAAVQHGHTTRIQPAFWPVTEIQIAGWSKDIDPKSEATLVVPLVGLLAEEHIEALRRDDDLSLELIGVLTFTDVFGQEISDEDDWAVLYLPKLDGRAEMFRHRAFRLRMEIAGEHNRESLGGH